VVVVSGLPLLLKPGEEREKKATDSGQVSHTAYISAKFEEGESKRSSSQRGKKRGQGNRTVEKGKSGANPSAFSLERWTRQL